MKRELSDGKFAAILFLLASCFFAVALLTTGCVSSGGPIVVPPPAAKPSPMCVVGVDRFNCWVEPMAGVFQYVCPVKDAAGNVTGTMNASSPTLCPGPMEPPIPPGPPVPATYCPKLLAPGARIYVQDKPYGQGFDSTVRIVGDPELCRLVHGVAVNDCHLEGWGQRSACELELLGKTVGKAQACAEWEFRETPASPWQLCRMSGSGAVTCDHHGEAAGGRDDPQTPPFEGTPAVCGEQRDSEGHPKAGTFIIAHGKGEVRACAPSHDLLSCGDPKPVDY